MRVNSLANANATCVGVLYVSSTPTYCLHTLYSTMNKAMQLGTPGWIEHSPCVGGLAEPCAHRVGLEHVSKQIRLRLRGEGEDGKQVSEMNGS